MRRMRTSGDKGKGGAKNIEQSEESFLPPTIDDERTCKRCYALDTCMLYRKVVSSVSSFLTRLDHSSSNDRQWKT
jgi:DNA replication ATP-dependent helicase Dna2